MNTQMSVYLTNTQKPMSLYRDTCMKVPHSIMSWGNVSFGTCFKFHRFSQQIEICRKQSQHAKIKTSNKNEDMHECTNGLNYACMHGGINSLELSQLP